MDPGLALDAVGEALRMCLVLAALPMAVALIVGIAVGALQTMMQLHEPTVALVPRLLAVSASLLVLLPWMLTRWVDYASELWRAMPTWLG